MTETHRRGHRTPGRPGGDGTDRLLPEATTYEELRARAVALRRQGRSRRQIRDELGVHNNDLLNRLVAGEPPPEWTKRPTAKDALRGRARELRRQGWTYDRIQLELGVSKSSISRWVRDLPKPPRRPRTREEASAIARRGWAATLQARECERQRTRVTAQRELGHTSDRDLFIAGVCLYWAEGSKSKPHNRSERVIFINSDPNVITLYLRWLRLLGVEQERLRFTVSIHESADVRRAEEFWADRVGVDVDRLMKTNLKRHNARTVRKNVGPAYHGCLSVRVLRGADLYRRIEGWWAGIVDGAPQETATLPDDTIRRGVIRQH